MPTTLFVSQRFPSSQQAWQQPPKHTLTSGHVFQFSFLSLISFCPLLLVSTQRYHTDGSDNYKKKKQFLDLK